MHRPNPKEIDLELPRCGFAL
jgi:hypothetical protein